MLALQAEHHLGAHLVAAGALQQVGQQLHRDGRVLEDLLVHQEDVRLGLALCVGGEEVWKDVGEGCRAW